MVLKKIIKLGSENIKIFFNILCVLCVEILDLFFLCKGFDDVIEK